MNRLSRLLILSLLITTGCGQKNDSNYNSKVPTSAKSVKVKSPRPQNAVLAPDFTLATVDGEWVSLQNLKGKVILLNFWGTWCPPCRREIPDFIKLNDKYKDDGLEIVGITLRSGTPQDIRRFMDKWGMNYMILTDIKRNETQMVAANYGQATGRPIDGVPTTFIIDRDGYIVKRYTGPRSEQVFYNDIKPYL